LRFSLVVAMVLHQHGAISFHGIALAFFLGELADIDFRNVALNSGLDELLTVLVALFCLRYRAGRGQRARQGDGQNHSFHSSTSSSIALVIRSEISAMRTACGCSCSYCGGGNTSPPSTAP